MNSKDYIEDWNSTLVIFKNVLNVIVLIKTRGGILLEKTYKLIDMHKYDPTKKNIFLFMLERNISKNANYLTYKYILNTVKVLKKDFNIFMIVRSSSAKEAWVKTVQNVEVMKDCIYVNLDANGSFIKGETGEREILEKYKDDKVMYGYTYECMQELFTNFIEGEPEIFNNLAGTLSTALFLVYERNHEIIPHDERTEKLLDGAKNTIHKRMTGERQFFSYRMASQRPLYPLHFLLRLMKDFDVWHYSFSHDTSSIWYPWVPELNPITKKVKLFYFENDQRGIRNFIKFPSSEIQEAFGRKEYTRSELDEIISSKKHDFIFGGTFPYDVGYRLNDWTRFFQDLDVDATIRTQTDGESAITGTEIKDPMETKKFKGKKIKDPAALDVIRNISINKNVKPTVSQEEYHEEQKDYMFTIILKCFYGKYDSLNFRIYSSLANGVIPLIANNYDIDDLQIPLQFKKYLVVENNSEIESLVSFYKNNPTEYKRLFWRMYEHYVKPEHFDEDWYYQEFKNNYFKEMY
jgi:hypothetical protein